MTQINIKRYPPKAAPLKKLVKFFWVLENREPILLDHKILPQNNIDLLFNFLSPMAYEQNGQLFDTPGNIYFQGFSDTYTVQKQQGPLMTLGVSFFPAGFYPFFGIPVSEFRHHTIGLDALVHGAAADLEDRLRQSGRTAEMVLLLEEFLLDCLFRRKEVDRSALALLNAFHSSRMDVAGFCREHQVNPRKLERLFNRHVGTSPKRFFRLSRFQSAVNGLMWAGRDLTTLTYELEYYDQPHFIRDFKSFTGSSPSAFLKEKRSFKQIMTLS